MTSMKGKTVGITGPTSGIGKEIAIGLAALGADLVLGCRDIAKGKAVTAEIERGKHDELLAQKGFYFELYMSQFKKQEEIDALIAN